jgi:hypothetical protein
MSNINSVFPLSEDGGGDIDFEMINCYPGNYLYFVHYTYTNNIVMISKLFFIIYL